MSDTVLVVISGVVATVTLNRPERLNALDDEMMYALDAAVDALAQDDSVRAFVLTGAGRGFCAGGDMQSLAGLVDAGGTGGTGARARSRDVVMRVTERIRAMPKVTIAAVNGPCAGAGLSLACGCDVRYASERALFLSAFLGVGQPGDFGSAWLLSRAVGAAKARELMLLGERVDAGEALRIGLVSAVFADDELATRADAAARRAADAPPLALAAMKANLDDAVTLGFSEYLDRELARYHERRGSDEARAAARAFLDRR